MIAAAYTTYLLFRCKIKDVATDNCTWKVIDMIIILLLIIFYVSSTVAPPPEEA